MGVNGGLLFSATCLKWWNIWYFLVWIKFRSEDKGLDIVVNISGIWMHVMGRRRQMRGPFVCFVLAQMISTHRWRKDPVRCGPHFMNETVAALQENKKWSELVCVCNCRPGEQERWGGAVQCVSCEAGSEQGQTAEALWAIVLSYCFCPSSKPMLHLHLTFSISRCFILVGASSFRTVVSSQKDIVLFTRNATAFHYLPAACQPHEDWYCLSGCFFQTLKTYI